MPKDFGERVAAREAEIAEKQDFELDIIADLIAYLETLSE